MPSVNSRRSNRRARKPAKPQAVSTHRMFTRTQERAVEPSPTPSVEAARTAATVERASRFDRVIMRSKYNPVPTNWHTVKGGMPLAEAVEALQAQGLTPGLRVKVISKMGSTLC